jgi:hypothetical protein
MPHSPTIATRKLRRAAAKDVHPAAWKPAIRIAGESAASKGGYRCRYAGCNRQSDGSADLFTKRDKSLWRVFFVVDLGFDPRRLHFFLLHFSPLAANIHAL